VDRLDRLAESAVVRLAVFALLAAALVWPMLPHAAWINEFRDAQVLTLHEHAAVESVRRFGELPLWNPWYCGGLYALGAPQARFAAPPFLLSLLFGPERAEPLAIFFFAIAGMEGTYRWVHLRVPSASAALRVAPIFALSGHFAVSVFRGWTNFFGFELVPWVLLGVTGAARGKMPTPRAIAVAAIAFAILLGFGGTFAAPIVAVAVALEALRILLEAPPSRRLRLVSILGVLASFLVTVAAVRLLPLAETLAAAPRIMAGTPSHGPSAILAALVEPLQPKSSDIADPGTFYVGPLFLVLVALGGSDRKSARALVLVLLCVWLSAGYARKPPLFALLRALPVFSALRYPERFLWIAILFASEPAANALARIPRLGDGPRWRLGANLVLTAMIGFTVYRQIGTFAGAVHARDLGALAEREAPEARDTGEPGFRQARGNRWLAAHAAALGTGSLSCWETHPVVMSPELRGDLAEEEYLTDPAAGTARRTRWTPNRIVVAVRLTRAARLRVNQNWHPGWRASVGTVVSDDGALAVDLPPGEHEVVLRFVPTSAMAGIAVTVAALVALVLLTRGGPPFRARRWVRTTLLVAAPWLVFAAFAGFAAALGDPRYPPAPQRNADGSPAIVETAPASASRVDARFGLPVVVDAVAFTGPDRIQNVGLDVYLRRLGPIPRTTTMFVRVVRRPSSEPARDAKDVKDAKEGKESVERDHQIVGGSFYLSDAPLEAEVHDSLGVHVGDLRPGDYDVWIGFGHVSGRRGRARVVDPGAAKEDDGLVRVGSFQR
jgi:hypothetical protein